MWVHIHSGGWRCMFMVEKCPATACRITLNASQVTVANSTHLPPTVYRSQEPMRCLFIPRAKLILASGLTLFTFPAFDKHHTGASLWLCWLTNLRCTCSPAGYLTLLFSSHSLLPLHQSHSHSAKTGFLGLINAENLGNSYSSLLFTV